MYAIAYYLCVPSWLIEHGTGLETRVYGIECGFHSSLPFWCHTETILRLTFRIVRSVLNWCMPKAANFTPDSPE